MVQVKGNACIIFAKTLFKQELRVIKASAEEKNNQEKK
jgi:hypothetical protein